MSVHSDPASGQQIRQKLAQSLRISGWISFWMQLILTAVSVVILGFAIADPNFNINLKSGFGLLAVGGGVVASILSIYWAFHYTRLARRLRTNDPEVYPSRSSVIKQLHRGVVLHFIAALFTLIAGQIIIGALLFKVMTIPQGITIYQSRQLIDPLDIFVVQASILMLTAQFIGVVIEAWLLKQLNHS